MQADVHMFILQTEQQAEQCYRIIPTANEVNV